jgi:hypothetical protein
LSEAPSEEGIEVFKEDYSILGVKNGCWGKGEGLE